jgi:WD40 repeat protein
MAPHEVHHLFHNPIADHSFSADRKTLAIARDTTVELYTKVGNTYKLQDELKGHDKTVTSVDIAPNSGRIVSCSQGKLPAPCPTFSHKPLTVPQIAMRSSGSLPPRATSLRLSFSALIAPLHLCAGRRPRPSSPSARETG